MLLNEVLGDVVISLITAAVIFSSQWVRTWITLRVPAGQIWGNFRKQRVEIVLTTAPEVSAKEFSTLVFPAEAAAASEVQSYLTKNLNSDCRINFSANFSPTKFDRNLVVIGGPLHNSVTSTLLDKIKNQSGFVFDGHRITLADGALYEATVRAKAGAQDDILTDFGVVLHTRNPLSPDSYITLLLGSRTYGCLAAARALLHNETKQFAQMVSKFDEYGAVVSCEVAGKTIHALKVESVWEVSSLRP